ncbi:MAG: carboxypeptidase regulatory-like domain-containing protein [Saprospiraceae bacterium]|nr:carboxypeptidase regulatory-like domain-containing protein [Saprospiraceae bacterium]MDW8482836.1 carboxypeptidase regulatory-like domain-containing protein [Saprospiraceae bacterium]
MVLLYRFLPILGVFLCLKGVAQISEGGLPPSFLPENAALFTAAGAVQVLTWKGRDLKQVLKEDAAYPERSRFAIPVSDEVSISSQKTGQWVKLTNGDRVWRCAVHVPEALGLLLLFDRLVLWPGCQLFAYSPDHAFVVGAYTEKSCMPSGEFLIGVVPGSTAMLEMVVAANSPQEPELHINRIDYVFDPAGLWPDGRPEDFGESLACNINVNCPLGQNWQTEKRGVARILMIFSNGAGWCSGSLVANTAGTAEPYFLTAYHCQIIGANPQFNLWRFDFGYEAPGCNNPSAEPQRYSVLGCQRIAFREETDFMLLKLNALPAQYKVYFNGWNRTPATNNLVQNSTFIHHPSGDIQKISRDNDPATVFPQSINWGGNFGISPPNTHWLVVPDQGIYQPGSSGCVLFDQNKRIVGQLHGGNLDPNTCTVSGCWFGRFDLSWDQGSTPSARLRDWLDPLGTSPLTQDGYDQPTFVSISGVIRTHWGVPMPNVVVQLGGGATATTRTDANGRYTFSNLAPGLNYTVQPSRDTNPTNGVTTLDLSLTNRHILALEPFDSPWKILAADANGSNSVTTLDLLDTRKLILALTAQFPVVPSWRFFPATTTFADPTRPFSGGLPAGILQFSNLQENVTNADFIGVKVGDVNNNANPGG